jgi:hypothetical protein
MNAPVRQGIPLRPDPGEARRRSSKSIHRMLASFVLGHRNRELPTRFCEKAFSADYAATLLTRAAASPDSTTSSAAALTYGRTNPLLLIAPTSAAARLFAHERALRVNLDGIVSVSVPHVSSHGLPLFVAEGQPIPVAQGATGSAVIGPVKKLSFIVSLSRELDESSPENAALVLGKMMGESAGRSLDSHVFDAVAGDSTRPSGLLSGVSPLTPSTSTSKIDAIASDLGSFASAFGAAMISSQDMLVVCNEQQGWSLLLTRGFEQPALPILMTNAVPAKQVIAIAPQGIGTGFSGAPEVEIAKVPLIHFEDTTPAQIGTPGAPPIVAAPAKSLFQQDLLGIKLRLKCSWTSLQPGSIQFMNNVSW